MEANNLVTFNNLALGFVAERDNLLVVNLANVEVPKPEITTFRLWLEQNRFFKKVSTVSLTAFCYELLETIPVRVCLVIYFY